MHREYAVTDDDLVAVGRAGYQPLPAVFDESSPLRRALRSHFERFQGLTSTAEGMGAGESSYESGSPIYKDTASGSQA